MTGASNAVGPSTRSAQSANGSGGITFAHAVTANIDTPRAERKKRLPAAQVSADISASPTANRLAVPSTERPISTTPRLATAIPSHWPAVACSRRQSAASTTVSGPCSCTSTEVSPGGSPACMAKNRKTNCPPNISPPMPASVPHEIAGLGTTSTGSAASRKRQVEKVKGGNSSRPKRITVKFRPHIATINSAASACSGVKRSQPDPGPRALVGRLPGFDGGLVAHGLGDVVQPVEQRMLAPRVDLEGNDPAGRRHDLAVLEIDRDARIARRGAHLVGELLDLFDRQGDRQQPVLEAVVVEDVAVRRRDHRLHAHAGERPHSTFTARAAAEILLRQDDGRAAIGLLVEHAIGVLAAVGLEADLLEAIGPEPGAASIVDQPLDPDDEVGVDILAHQRRCDAGDLGELFH